VVRFDGRSRVEKGIRVLVEILGLRAARTPGRAIHVLVAEGEAEHKPVTSAELEACS
jgi:hypothetical protein